MGMRGDEVIKLLNVVPLQRVDHCFSFVSFAGVDEYCFAGRRSDEDRISVDGTNVKNPNRKFAAGSWRRLIAQPRPDEFPVRGASGDEYHEDHCNRTSATPSSSSHSRP